MVVAMRRSLAALEAMIAICFSDSAVASLQKSVNSHGELKFTITFTKWFVFVAEAKLLGWCLYCIPHHILPGLSEENISSFR